MWGSCKACKAKDEEIAHLLALLNEAHEDARKANARLAEVVAPGVNRRADPAQRPTVPRPMPRPVIQSFPGYEREYAPEPVVVDDGA